MAENPQPPQEKIDALIRRIGTDQEAYTASILQLQSGFTKRDKDLSDMLTECMRIASIAIDLVRQNNQFPEEITRKLQELDRVYGVQNTQLTAGLQESLALLNKIQDEGQLGTAELEKQLASLNSRFEAVQAQVRDSQGPARVDGSIGGYSNKKKPKRGGYAYVGSPGKVRTKTRTRNRIKTRNRTRRSLAGKASSSKRSSKRSTRRKQKRSRRQ